MTRSIAERIVARDERRERPRAARCSTTTPTPNQARTIAAQRSLDAFAHERISQLRRRARTLMLPAAVMPEILLGRASHPALERRSCTSATMRSTSASAIARFDRPATGSKWSMNRPLGCRSATAEHERRARAAARTRPARAASWRAGRRTAPTSTRARPRPGRRETPRRAARAARAGRGARRRRRGSTVMPIRWRVASGIGRTAGSPCAAPPRRAAMPRAATYAPAELPVAEVPGDENQPLPLARARARRAPSRRTARTAR